MAPFDRRPKVSNHALQPANSNKVSRAPWEREDDDEFGPPPALDLSPGDAESEAKRMIYEKKHPLHDAIVQSGHINHNHAMRRYSSLMRRAWDPAARTIPVQPARIIGNDDLARPANSPAPAHGSPLVRALQPRTPDPMLGAAHKVSSQKDPASDRRPKQMSPGEDDGTAIPVRPQGINKSRDFEPPLTSEAWADMEESVRQDRARLFANQRGSDPDPSFAIAPSTFAAAKDAVESRSDLSDSAKSILLSLIGYEDLVPDVAGGSFGGITAATFKALKSFVSEFRTMRGAEPIAAQTAADLSTDELLDFQYVYLVVELEPRIFVPTLPSETKSEKEWEDEVIAGLEIMMPRIAASNVLDRLGPNAIAFQIADSLFNNDPERGANIVQYAINRVIDTMTPKERAAGGFAEVMMDGIFGSKTLNAAIALANDPRYRDEFLQ